MPKVRGFPIRLKEAIGQRKKADFAASIGVRPHQLSRYLSGQVPDANTLIRIAEVSRRSLDWLLTGREDVDRWKDLFAAAFDVKGARRAGAGEDGRTQLGRATARLARVEKEVALLEKVHIVAEAMPGYKGAPEDVQHLLQVLDELGADERAALLRCADALVTGDEQVKAHLVNQMDIVRRAIDAKPKRGQKRGTN